MFGKEAVYEIIRRNSKTGAGELLDTVLYAVNRFQGGQQPADDITLMIVKVK